VVEEGDPDGRVTVISRDRRRRATRRLPLAIDDARGPLALLLRIVASFRPTRGLRLTAEASAPAGAGLGGSSTLGIAAAGAVSRWCGTHLPPARLLRRVMSLETIELGVPTGEQDYLAALHGGLSAYHHEPDGTRRETLRIHPGLAERLVLAYTGRPRRSGLSNWDMFRRFVDGERATVRRMETIAAIAREMVDALRAGDLETTGRLVGEEGALRYALAPSVSTPELARADRAARSAGAIGVKVCGAGGGGCLVAFAGRGRRAAVAAALAASGARVREARIARRGLRARGRIPIRGRRSAGS
jgi:D-glycero-alpha-D-manno-heptose-7-phosphate kinase